MEYAIFFTILLILNNISGGLARGKYHGGSSYGGGGHGTLSLKLSPGGAYSYKYSLNDQDKSEVGDGAGHVLGQFSFTDPQGQNKAIQYKADEGGFQPEGAHIPTDTYSTYGSGGGGAYSFSGGSAASSYKSSSAYASSSHSSSASTGFGSSFRGGVGGGGSGVLKLNLQPGGAYSYSYDLNDQSKAETRDHSGKVKGGFSFTDPQGQKKAIEYTADEGGFQAKGDHIPTDSNTGAGTGSFGTGAFGTGSTHFRGGAGSFGGGASSFGSSSFTGSSYSGYRGSGVRSGGGSGTLNLSLKPGGVYSYDYKLNDQAKSESRGADGKVTGGFSFTNPEGQNLAIQYKADELGFQAEGDHIPKPSAEFLKAHRDAAQASKFSGSSSGGLDYSSSGSYTGGAGSFGSASGSQSDLAGTGGPFSFSYDAGDHGHSASSSGGSSVSGQYAAQSAGGSTKVSYTAQGKEGFNPIVEATASVGKGAGTGSSYGGFSGSGYKGLGSFSSTGGGLGGSAGGAFGTGSSFGSGSSSSFSSGAGGKQSYSFSYSTDDHAHSQSKQGGGLVQGQYLVSAPGSQKVSFSAGGQQGYLSSVDASSQVGKGLGGGSGSGFTGGATGSFGGLGKYTGIGSSFGSSGSSGSSSSFGSGGSYSFNYQTDSHGHHGKGSGGNVEGKYSSSGDRASQKSIYTANKEGFFPTHSIDINVGSSKTKAGY